jgi:hypothetical protein
MVGRWDRSYSDTPEIEKNRRHMQGSVRNGGVFDNVLSVTTADGAKEPEHRSGHPADKIP